MAASEAYEAERVRKKAVAAIEVLKRRNPSQTTAWSWAGEIGSTVLAVACVVAGATGHAEIAAPCVVTGALYSGATRLFKLSR